MKLSKILIVLSIIFFAEIASAEIVEQIDPYPLAGIRKIPDIDGNPGDSITLASDAIIDILILGDGFLVDEDSVFFAKCSSWYNSIIVMRPYKFFKEAFRVRALYEESAERVNGPDDSLRNSYYAVMLDSLGKTSPSGWTGNSTGKDSLFKARLYQSIADLPSPKVLDKYPSSLDNSVGGSNYITSMNDTYKNLYIAMFLSKDTTYRVSGRAFHVKDLTTDTYVQIGMGTSEVHEFGHTFGYLRDEYIEPRNTTANRENPHPDSLSVFNLSNLAYSKNRDEILWEHLSPGMPDNPDVFSLVGNLFEGGSSEDSVWHSEYKCLLNGGHKNYTCNDDPIEPNTELRDYRSMCFWCEELVALRILERTSFFGTYGGSDVNDSGIAWYSNWVSQSRDDYFNYFDIHSLIEEKNTCYAIWDEACSGCEGACQENDLPPCLPTCSIREIGHAIYVEESIGNDGNEGTKAEPKATISNGITTANANLGGAKLVILKPGTYPGSITFSIPVTITSEGCDTVLVGK